MRTFLWSLALMLTSFSTAALAEKNLVVVELYTSQGCSSCPPADEMLAELSQRDDVIALALHVDYWDYIGWVDEFADPRHTQRQQDYARAAGERTIYTPQFVVGGQDLVIGARGMQVADLIQTHRETPPRVDVGATRDGATVQILAETLSGNAAGPYVVQLAQIEPSHTVDIRRGENAGKSVTYVNIVRSLSVLGRWDGVAPFEMEAEVPAEYAAAIIVQMGTNGPVVGAAKLD